MKIVHKQVQDNPEHRRRVAILGFAREGKTTLKFLQKSPVYKNSEFYICDKNSNLEAPKGIKTILGKNYLKNLGDFDIAFRTPGIPYNLPEIQKAVKNGVKISSATGLFFEEAQKIKGVKVIGITGTKGKGTTATLLYKILKACGKNALLAGNIGKSPLDIIPQLKGNSIAILELSSFQLQDLKISPDVAVVLNVFPDHMDSHKDFKEYFDAKANIARFQKNADKIFYDATNKNSRLIAQKSKAKKIPVDFRKSNYISAMPGEHNAKNAAMATAIAASLGCPKEKIAKIIKDFKGNEHRLEFVRSIRVNPPGSSHKFASITFYNDSASTNPQTTVAAINAFKEPKTRALNKLSARPSTKRETHSALVLIAGGKDKGLDYEPLTKTLKRSNTELVILFGENKNKIAKTIKNSGVGIKMVKNLNDAIQLAFKRVSSSKLQVSSSIVLFSPAAASFDMFKDYADRGKQFKQLVKRLK